MTAPAVVAAAHVALWQRARVGAAIQLQRTSHCSCPGAAKNMVDLFLPRNIVCEFLTAWARMCNAGQELTVTAIKHILVGTKHAVPGREVGRAQRADTVVLQLILFTIIIMIVIIIAATTSSTQLEMVCAHIS